MTSLWRGLLVIGIFLALASTAVPTAADDLNATLQQVVQHASDQQVQAIATRNLSLLADGTTDDYYQQLRKTFQEMLDFHVTGISLLKLEWGPISVTPDGSLASLTTYESWRIISTEGMIDYDPVRNDYTLVLDNGSWRIKSDVQTQNPAPTPTGQTATPTATPTLTVTPTPAPTDTPTPTPTATPTPSGEEMQPAAPGDDTQSAPPGDGAPPPADPTSDD